tara:strand:+ start:6776 stop:7585 length:810 start_codon:yes stop_codon:yes gene_type:complete
MKLKQKKQIAQFNTGLYQALYEIPTSGKLEIAENQTMIDINGSFKSLDIKYNGNVYIINKLTDGYGIKVSNNIIKIRNILGKSLNNDNILFNFKGNFTPISAQVVTFGGSKFKLSIINRNIQDLINYSKTNVEDSTLLFLEEGDDNSDVFEGFNSGVSKINDDSIKGLYASKPFADGYAGYYNFHPKEKVYMTGKRLTNQSIPIGTTKYKFNSPSHKKALKKIYNKLVKNESIRKAIKSVNLDKQVEKVKTKTIKPLIKKQKITKGGKY